MIPLWCEVISRYCFSGSSSDVHYKQPWPDQTPGPAGHEGTGMEVHKSAGVDDMKATAHMLLVSGRRWYVHIPRWMPGEYWSVKLMECFDGACVYIQGHKLYRRVDLAKTKTAGRVQRLVEGALDNRYSS